MCNEVNRLSNHVATTAMHNGGLVTRGGSGTVLWIYSNINSVTLLWIHSNGISLYVTLETLQKN